MQNTPISDSYWLVPGKLLAGEYPGAQAEAEARLKLRAFLNAGVTCFLDLTEEEEGLHPYMPLLSEEAENLKRAVIHRRLAIPDRGIPPVELMREIQQLIANALEEGHVLYVHCWGGIGRTGTVAGCYLVEQGMSGEEALAEIARLRQATPDRYRKSPETVPQMSFVKSWRQFVRKQSHRRTVANFAGCLLGGAVGDALGAPVEFHSIQRIRSEYGPEGIKDYDVAYGRRGAITDDTQMTLFTAEGLLRAITRQRDKGVCDPATVIHHAYIRWLHTQSERSRSLFSQDKMDGWLIGVTELHSRRAPGNTCLAALRGEEMGGMQRPLNNSKGCGGVMRVAPVGLFAENEERAFGLGCAAAAITHGHPSGYYSAGCFAAIIYHLAEGRPLPEAIELTLRHLEMPENEDHEECAAAIRQAVTLWRDRDLAPSPEVIERMGGGWVGEEALAISLYCALVAQDDFACGVLLAVNHSGDSESTGAITGNILGLMLGVEALPEKWLTELELRAEIEAVAGDLFKRFEDTDDWRERYPGW